VFCTGHLLRGRQRQIQTRKFLILKWSREDAAAYHRKKLIKAFSPPDLAALLLCRWQNGPLKRHKTLLRHFFKVVLLHLPPPVQTRGSILSSSAPFHRRRATKAKSGVGFIPPPHKVFDLVRPVFTLQIPEALCLKFTLLEHCLHLPIYPPNQFLEGL
jgi:hypothetical protein